MTFAVHTLPGCQPIAETSATQKHVLGTIVRATDPSLGEGEFIYLLGVTSTTVGSIVRYDVMFQSALATTAATGPSFPCAVAMSANVGTYYGWYQISGMAVAVKAADTSFAVGAGLGCTAGVAVAVATGCLLQNAVARTAPHSTTTNLTLGLVINRPSNLDYK